MKKDFWVTNITNKNVTLRDLNLTIKARTSINLLDYKRYGYKLEDLERSSTKGSLYKKRSMIVVRNQAPDVTLNNFYVLSKTYLPSRAHSIVSVKQEVYEELNVSDEKFAEDNIETVQMDEINIKRV